MSAPRRVTISLPRGLAAELERLRLREQRTRSGLLQEALRAYLEARGPAEQAAPRRVATRRRPEADAGLHARMATRLLEQERLSQGLIALRDALTRKLAGARP